MRQTCCGKAAIGTVERCCQADGPLMLTDQGRGTQFLAAGRDAHALCADRAESTGEDGNTGRTSGAGRAGRTGRAVGAGRAGRATRAHTARVARLALLIQQFQQDTDLLDDAVADRLGISRTELRSDELRHAETTRLSQLTPDQLTPDRAVPVPGQAATVPGQAATVPGQAATVPGQAAPATLPAGARSLLRELFGDPAREFASGPAAETVSMPFRYSAAEIDALDRFFSAAHARRQDQIQRIRAGVASGRPGAA